MNVLVTGANGFVGKALINKLLKKGHNITALVRSLESVEHRHPEVTWLEGDLLIPDKLPELGQIHKAYYLVHGLKGEKANFEHFEALAAVNFVNWIRGTTPDIIYLGGLGPKNTELSAHLRSRHLTGAILGASGLGAIEFRASIILGEGSLSFEMIKAISERLPFRPDMGILSHPCQPLALSDLLIYLEKALELTVTGHQIFEIGGPDITTYGDLMDIYADISGHKRKRVKLPEVEAKVILKALEYAIPEHADIGKKLAESLEFATVVSDEASKDSFVMKPMSLRDAMKEAVDGSKTKYSQLWEKDFLKGILSDKILTQSGLFSPDLLKSLEKVGKIKDILTRR